LKRNLLRRSAPLAAVAVFAALPALGQISTQTPPSERTLPEGEQIEREMATARFRLGPVRLLPFFRLYNMGWTNNALVTSEGTVDDYTASVSAGTRLVVPFGRKLFFRAYLAPTYDWYYRTEALRGFGGSYSGELLGLFNRLTVGAGGGYSEKISTVSSEVARDVFNTTASGTAKVEVKVLDRLSLFGGAEFARLKQEDPNANTPGLAPVSDLDRTETAYRGGIRYAFSSVLSFGVMGEVVGIRFDQDAELRDGNARSLSFVARYDRERFFVEATVGATELKAVTPNEYFPESRGMTYAYFVSYFLSRPLELQVRGSRRPVASLFLDNPYYLETRNGVTARLAVGRRLSFRATGELGSNAYVNPVIVVETGEVVVRRDAATSYGGGFDFRVSRSVSVGLILTKDRWDSNIDYYDRETLRVTAGLSITTDFSREERR
jgi:hypothetical protein